jgi:hypothetical protein
MTTQLELRTPAKGAVGAIVGLIPQRGEWLVAYSVMKAGKGSAPVIVDVCRISELPALQRKKAETWMAAFGRLAEIGTVAEGAKQ